MKKENKISLIFVVGIIIVFGFIILNGVAPKDYNIKDDEILEEEANKNLEDKEFDKYIELNDIVKTFKKDNLELKFVGTQIMDNFYNYTLEIILNGKIVDSKIFGNIYNKIIWSSNHASSFRVMRLDNYYIFISSVEKEVDGSYVLILDNDGNVLKTFEDIYINVDKENLKLETSDCITEEVDEICKKTTYKLKELK